MDRGRSEGVEWFTVAVPVLLIPRFAMVGTDDEGRKRGVGGIDGQDDPLCGRRDKGGDRRTWFGRSEGRTWGVFKGRR